MQSCVRTHYHTVSDSGRMVSATKAVFFLLFLPTFLLVRIELEPRTESPNTGLLFSYEKVAKVDNSGLIRQLQNDPMFPVSFWTAILSMELSVLQSKYGCPTFTNK